MIGRKGAEVDRIRKDIERVTKKRVDVKVEDMNSAASEARPETDATLLAQGVAEQLAGRVCFRRAMRRAVQTAMRSGALGVRVQCGGRLGGDRDVPARVVPRGPRPAAHAPGEDRLRDRRGQDDVRPDRREGLGLPRRRDPAGRAGDRAPARPRAGRRSRSGGGASTGALITDVREAAEVAEPEAPAAERSGRKPAAEAEPSRPAADAARPSRAEAAPRPRSKTSGRPRLRHEAAPTSETETAPAGETETTQGSRSDDGRGGEWPDARPEEGQAPQGAPRPPARAAPRAAPRSTSATTGSWRSRPAWITNRQIEAARVAITRHIRRGGKVWINIFPDKPVTKKPAETRMGSGKGNPEGWVAVVKPGRVMFELAGVPEDLAKEAMLARRTQAADQDASSSREREVAVVADRPRSSASSATTSS